MSLLRPSVVVAFALPALIGAACTLPAPDPGPAPIEQARDPGPRGGAAGAGDPLGGLSLSEKTVFLAGKDDFEEVEDIKAGIGPTLNLDSCGGCHAYPAIGGTSPKVNPQIALAGKLRNKVPPFIQADGPVREARFVRNADGSPDGGVHALFTVAGAPELPGCNISQPDFATELARNNVIFRIPTPVFGGGLLEQIQDAAILANITRDVERKKAMGIGGRANIVLPHSTISGQANKSGNDGTVGRFGWKAQNKSLLIFSGEAYNVEMGISNEAFPNERDETAACQHPEARVPNSVHNLDAGSIAEGISSIERFSFFMRLLDAPKRSPDRPGGAASIERGRTAFGQVGCALCHHPAFTTGNSTIQALRYQRVELYSDLLLHDMGEGLADGISQGQANGREFRTAPLWGAGQRLFFMHDGRAADLREAVRAHYSRGSEANSVVREFYRLPGAAQQDVYNFLRSL